VARSFARVLRADPGFNPEGLLTLRVPMPAQLFAKPEDAFAVQDRIEDALAAIPGVRRVSGAGSLPPTALGNQATVRIPGAPGNTGNKDRDALALVPDVRAAIRRVDSRLALANVQSMDAIVKDALRQQRISAVLIAGFAFGALLLAAMGLFGVVSRSVTRRCHELAVRLALGANHRRILGLVIGEGVKLVGIGLLIGVPGISFAGGLIRGVLVGVSPLDPLTLVTVAAGLMLVAMVACFFPARRALRIDPARSLRQE
jgi:hypothetical protein